MKISGIFLFSVLLLVPFSVFAHPGGTDATGGHHCWTDCEKWGLHYGEYHYHGADDEPIVTYDNNDDIYDRALAKRLSGQILLQVEEHGEAFWIRPDDDMRFYLRDGDAAYNLMRFYSLGISDGNLSQVPIVYTTDEMKAADSVCTSNTLASQLSGQILLQVEQHGEAYYVDPTKCTAIYMKDGEVAYEVMRFLGLGILNNDLDLIPEWVD